MAVATREYTVHLRKCITAEGVLHGSQDLFVNSTYKRIIIRAGRRGGKTLGIAKRAVKKFLAGRRQLYTAPTAEQTDAFWFEVTRALREPIDAGVFKLDKSERFIEVPGTKQRIKAKTAWDADSMRGDYADDLYLDEYQLTNESAWEDVGQPMLIDKNGDAVFIYTPPSLKSAGRSQAKDPRHASKLFKKAQADTTGLWQAIYFTTLDNPFISQEAIKLASEGMSLDSYRREILAQDDEIETSWLVHGMWNETLCKIKRFEIPHNWDIYSGHDFGSSNPAALFLARVKLPLPAGAAAYMRQGDIVAWREYAPGAGYSMIQHVDRFKEIVKGYQVKRSRGGNFTTEDEIRQGYTRAGWCILPPVASKVNVQVDRVIQLEEGNRLYIFDDMWQTLGQMANCLWELDDENKPTTGKIANDGRNHILACLRYIASDEDFRSEMIVERRREAVSI